MQIAAENCPEVCEECPEVCDKIFMPHDPHLCRVHGIPPEVRVAMAEGLTAAVEANARILAARER